MNRFATAVPTTAKVTPDGSVALTGTNEKANRSGKFRVWDGTSLEMVPQRDFQMRANCRFDKAPAAPEGVTDRLVPSGKEAWTGGLLLYEPTTKRHVLAYVDFGQQTAGFAVDGLPIQSVPTTVPASTRVEIQVAGQLVTLLVNGERVGVPFPLGPEFEAGYQVGVGGLDPHTVVFSDVAVMNEPAAGR